jgi:hypothetical protein
MIENKIVRQLTEFILSNVFWYLFFSFLYFDMNPLNWWLTQSVWGRVIVVFIEATIIARIDKSEKLNKTKKNKEDEKI